jgi:hypothetical protein
MSLLSFFSRPVSARTAKEKVVSDEEGKNEEFTRQLTGKGRHLILKKTKFKKGIKFKGIFDSVWTTFLHPTSTTTNTNQPALLVMDDVTHTHTSST